MRKYEPGTLRELPPATPSNSYRVSREDTEVLEEGVQLFTNLTGRALKNSKLLRERARYYVAIGKPEYAQQLMEVAIRSGGWHRAGLWWELVASMSSCDDYARVRTLWSDSPKRCHADASILRAVARAACISGWHEDSRALLRRAALISASEASHNSAFARIPALVRGIGTKAKGERAVTDASFSRAASEALVDLNDAFARLGPKAFLISGTLLGLIREGKIIGWDKDIDLGVFAEDCPSDMEAFFRRHERFHLGRVDLTTDRLRVIHANGTWIDIFPHYREGDKVWHDGSATRWWNTPFELKKMDFLNVEQYVPDEPERYLDENYGDWRTPNMNFDARIDAPNVEIMNKDHHTTLLFFSLESSIRKCKAEMRDRYIRILREAGEGGWLDRL